MEVERLWPESALREERVQRSPVTEDGDTAEALLKNADHAMYRAKEAGPNLVQLFTPSMNTRAMERMSLENSLRHAIELSRKCAPSPTAYSVGAVIVDAAGNEIASGFSRDTDPYVHAEESALRRLAAGDPRLAGATVYSTLEPCTERRSRIAAAAREALGRYTIEATAARFADLYDSLIARER